MPARNFLPWTQFNLISDARLLYFYTGLELGGTIKSTKVEIKGRKDHSECTFERAGLWSWLQFGSGYLLAVWTKEVSSLWASVFTHRLGRLGTVTSELLRGLRREPTERAKHIFGFSPLPKALSFQAEAFGGWGIQTELWEHGRSRQRTWGLESTPSGRPRTQHPVCLDLRSRTVRK